MKFGVGRRYIMGSAPWAAAGGFMSIYRPTMHIGSTWVVIWHWVMRRAGGACTLEVWLGVTGWSVHSLGELFVKVWSCEWDAVRLNWSETNDYDTQISKRQRRHEIQLVSNTRLAWLASTFNRRPTNPNVGRLAHWNIMGSHQLSYLWYDMNSSFWAVQDYRCEGTDRALPWWHFRRLLTARKKSCAYLLLSHNSLLMDVTN